MGKYLIVCNILVIVLLFSACEKTKDIESDNEIENDTNSADLCFSCNLSASAQLIFNQLLEAYNDLCITCLEDILIEWKDKYSHDSEMPDSLQDIYDVYKEFYSPWDLSRIAYSEFGYEIYQDIFYYLIQSGIEYDYYFKSYGDISYTINDFRPEINDDTINCLYLSTDYKSAINCFLGSDEAPGDFNDIVKLAFLTGETHRRYVFLRNFLLFIPGHWGDYWHLETHPEVWLISFNEVKDSAQVYFRIGYEGGEAILGKENDSWKIVDHYMTWIE
ncbi:MAG: hypothetical protein JW894_13365 [Bacteroidales bacterium]|nr:hypothetical protein [Bacteroidales bacterium]